MSTGELQPAIDPGQAPQEPPLDQVLDRLADIKRQLDEFHRRSAHREAVIDRLHEENQELRTGLQRLVLDPVVADLIRLHGALAREAARLDGQPPTAGAAGALLGSFATDVELILDRCGVEPFSTSPGDPYRPGEHEPLGTVPTADADRHNTLVEVLAVGFRERDSGRVRRPVQARFHRYQEPPAADAVEVAQVAPEAPHPEPE